MIDELKVCKHLFTLKAKESNKSEWIACFSTFQRYRDIDDADKELFVAIKCVVNLTNNMVVNSTALFNDTKRL